MTFLNGIRRFGIVLLMAIICAFVGAVLALLVAGLAPRTYSAQVSLIAPAQADTFADVADSTTVMQSVVTQLNLSTSPQALALRVSATASKTSTLLTVDALDPDPNQAAAIANATAAALIQLAPTISGSSESALKSIDADLTTVQTEITRTEVAVDQLSGKTEQTPAQAVQLIALQSQLSTFLTIRSSLLTLQVSYSQTVLTVLGPADVPTRATAPLPLTATLIGGLAGLGIGIGVGLLILYMRGDAAASFQASAPGGGSSS